MLITYSGYTVKSVLITFDTLKRPKVSTFLIPPCRSSITTPREATFAFTATTAPGKPGEPRETLFWEGSGGQGNLATLTSGTAIRSWVEVA